MAILPALIFHYCTFKEQEDKLKSLKFQAQTSIKAIVTGDLQERYTAEEWEYL